MKRGNRRDDRDPVHVLVVDDSAVMRQIMSGALAVGGLDARVAADPLIAMRKMREQRPDVILLDLEMPRMDGLTFLRKIMTEDPIPVVVCSSHVGRGTESALRALEEGAVELVAKPASGVRDFLLESAAGLVETIRAAARARPQPRQARALRPGLAVQGDLRVPPLVARRPLGEQIVVIGASTGGPEALRRMLEALPVEVPGIVVVQHMPDYFLASFASRLDRHCRIEVRQAKPGDPVVKGRALIAPGNLHTIVTRDAAGYKVSMTEDPQACRHRPSVDVLFRSVARAAGPSGVGVILTGMGDDGASGLLEMKQAGASTIAQDEASCVVFGMPKAAIARGAVDTVVPLAGLPAVVLSRISRQNLNRTNH